MRVLLRCANDLIDQPRVALMGTASWQSCAYHGGLIVTFQPKEDNDVQLAISSMAQLTRDL